MSDLPVLTTIVLPPRVERTKFSFALLWLLGGMALVVLTLLIQDYRGPSPTMPEDTVRTALGAASPIIVEVHANAVIQYPSVTPTHMAMRTPTPAANDFCNPSTRPGQLCLRPYPTPMPPTPVPSCSDEHVNYGSLCTWQPTPVPTIAQVFG